MTSTPRQRRGWPDVAYNFFIASDGVVYEARTGSLARAVEASATGGSQGFAQLVCLLGDFTSQNPSQAALTSLNATLAWLADRHGLDTSAGATATFTSRGSNRWPEGTEVTTSIIAGHRDMSQTACPGDTFYPYLVANVQAEVHEQRTGVEPTSAGSTTSSRPSTPSTAPESSTTAPVHESTSAPDAPPTVAPDASPASVATATVDTPPPPAVDESAAATPEAAGPGRDSSNGTAIAVVAGAAVLTGAGAVYVGLRQRSDDASAPDEESPLPSADA